MKGRDHVGGWINYHQQNTTDPKTDIAVLKVNPEDVKKKMDKALGRIQISEGT